MSSSGGNVGTNGNLTISGSVDVQGNLYTPRTGVGACTAGAVDALTEIGHAHVEGSIVQLPDRRFLSHARRCRRRRRLPPQEPSAAPRAPARLLGLTAANCTVAAAATITIDGHGSTLSLPERNVGIAHQPRCWSRAVPPRSTTSTASSCRRLDSRRQRDRPDAGRLVDVVGKNPDDSSHRRRRSTLSAAPSRGDRVRRPARITTRRCCSSSTPEPARSR